MMPTATLTPHAEGRDHADQRNRRADRNPARRRIVKVCRRHRRKRGGRDADIASLTVRNTVASSKTK
jgi:hypothetical protein